MTQVSPFVVAVVIVAIFAVVYYLTEYLKKKESFVSQQAKEVYTKSKDLFDTTQGSAKYTDFKNKLPNSDPVTYTDVRNLWKQRELSPENVQKVL